MKSDKTFTKHYKKKKKKYKLIENFNRKAHVSWTEGISKKKKSKSGVGSK